MKTSNAPQQLTIPAIFANSPMLNIGQCNELHNHRTCRKHFCRKYLKFRNLAAIAAGTSGAIWLLFRIDDGE